MSHFTERASQLLDAAQSACAHGEVCPDMTVLIGHDGALRLIAHSDWPLESLARERAASAAYRVTQSAGAVRVEGRQGLQRCLLEAPAPAATARLLL